MTRLTRIKGKREVEQDHLDRLCFVKKSAPNIKWARGVLDRDKE